ncbi:uncharacterized protein BJ171DRAFT_487549 [Polychytrium aggregatum]|uniref:uncharacterized protein n=1 Tax=Polychytrium aggregatum TaxID=110093 RepID=UPI0022FE4777|nr:uncharacterized protein BJ171DRAFT_487549 [Polychytrium aggregatum]KAI9208880.1 hypothetical protein BJ171DRAFT_487549 [Polychytrium aggregatum]
MASLTFSAAKRKALYSLVERARISDDSTSRSDAWVCCGHTFALLPEISRHISRDHAADILQALDSLLATPSKSQDSNGTSEHGPSDDRAHGEEQDRRASAPFTGRRAAKGSSDSVALRCQCDGSGTVILFYKYCAVDDPTDFCKAMERLCAGLTGKVRISSEGLNVTLAGSDDDIDKFVQAFASLPIFGDSDWGCSSGNTNSDGRLEWTPQLYCFFKPSPGCIHVFDSLSIKAVPEICPLGLNNSVQTPSTMRHLGTDTPKLVGLTPPEFHQKLSQALDDPNNYLILDTRNYYESKIGFFEGAVLPPIRKFSSFPHYFETNRDQLLSGKKEIITYCTGGIRCEKASAWVMEQTDMPVYMLEGGIHMYIEWINGRARNSDPPGSTLSASAVSRESQLLDIQKHLYNPIAGNDETEAAGQEFNPPPASSTVSLFRGKNYVFDARQSLGLIPEACGPESSPVSQCQQCRKPQDHLAKCAGQGCHLLIVVCPDCLRSIQKQQPADPSGGLYCCRGCQAMQAEFMLHQSCNSPDTGANARRWKRRICDCENERRQQIDEHSMPRTKQDDTHL